MRSFGFSTGSIAMGNYKKAIDILDNLNLDAIELSALRENEIKSLTENLGKLNLDKYRFISFHAPSTFTMLSEEKILEYIQIVYEKGLFIVVHPDAISNFDKWRKFGNKLCIENMDKRKPIGRNAEELERIFKLLPEASLCFDIGHSRQVDPTMSEATKILRNFKTKLKYIHMSEVNSLSRHESMSIDAVTDFRKVSNLIPKDCPIIIESMIDQSKIEIEVFFAKLALNEWKFVENDKHVRSSWFKMPNESDEFFEIFNSYTFCINDKFKGKVYFNNDNFEEKNDWKCNLNNNYLNCRISSLKDQKFNGKKIINITATLHNVSEIKRGTEFAMKLGHIHGYGFVTSINK